MVSQSIIFFFLKSVVATELLAYNIIQLNVLTALVLPTQAECSCYPSITELECILDKKFDIALTSIDDLFSVIILQTASTRSCFFMSTCFLSYLIKGCNSFIDYRKWKQDRCEFQHLRRPHKIKYGCKEDYETVLERPKNCELQFIRRHHKLEQGNKKD